MKTSVAQCRHLLTMARAILAGLDDGHRALEPRPGTKTAGWLIGHMSVTGDYARRLCGRPPLCPVEWRPLFNPGTLPSEEASVYPPMTVLCEALRAVYTDLCDAAPAADPSALAAVNPFAPGRAGFPTTGDFVAYLLTGHFAYHLGQLTAWRAAAGMGRIQRSDTLAA